MKNRILAEDKKKKKKKFKSHHNDTYSIWFYKQIVHRYLFFWLYYQKTVVIKYTLIVFITDE